MQDGSKLGEPLLDARTEQALADSQRLGGEIMGELYEQRRALEFAAGNYRTLDDDLDNSTGLITRLLRRAENRRRLWILSVVLMFIVVLVTIHLKAAGAHQPAPAPPPHLPPSLAQHVVSLPSG